MAKEKRSRGRPKGSGIDDRGKLLDIGRLIERDPGLRPTTAIRKLGYNDPSTIRRLRDKYNAGREDIHMQVRAELADLPAAQYHNDNTTFSLPTDAAREALRRAKDIDRRSPKETILKSPRQAARRTELSCLLAIGAHALAQAAACCAELEDDSEISGSTDSHAFLAEMLFMMSRNRTGEETVNL